jgi:hypothetical protein
MRIVSWNCCDGFERKFGHLERLKPDVAIVSEVRPSCLRSAALQSRSIWRGEEGQKGLAIICYGDWRIVEVGPEVPEQWFIPAVVTNGTTTVQVLGAWLKQAPDYVTPTKAALEKLRDFIVRGPTVLAGDLNQSITFDRDAGPGRRFAEVLDTLRDLGLASAWHTHKGEEHGNESSATLYWRWNRESRFHIDFVFYPPASLIVSSVEIGTCEQYVEGKISDHVPLAVNFVRR